MPDDARPWTRKRRKQIEQSQRTTLNRLLSARCSRGQHGPWWVDSSGEHCLGCGTPKPTPEYQSIVST